MLEIQKLLRFVSPIIKQKYILLAPVIGNPNILRQSKVSMIFDIRYSEESNIANIKLAPYSEVTPGGGGLYPFW